MSEARDKFLGEANVAVISTVDRKGRPHATPVWYLYDDGEFRISVGRGSQKHRNLEANPEMSLVVDSRPMPYYAVMMQGTAEFGPELSDENRLTLAVRYLGDELGKRYAESMRDGDSVTIHFRPRKIIEYDPLGTRR
jgi:PPOX class probable F420-dependent enzyme